MAGRLRALRRYARGQDSTSRSHMRRTSCRWSRARSVPSSYAFDYEFARTQHGLGCRTAAASSSPTPSRKIAWTARRAGPRCAATRAEGGVLPPRLRSRPVRAGRSRDRARARARRRSDAARGVALPPAWQSAVRRRALAARARPRVQAVVLPRTAEQRVAIRRRALPSLVIPEHAIDAQSLVALRTSSSRQGDDEP